MEHEQWRFRFWRVPFLHGVELFYGHDVTFDYPRHIHEDFSLGAVLAGTDTTFRPEGSFTASAGDIQLINAGEVHASRSVGTRYRIFHITPGCMQEICEHVMGSRVLPSFPRGAIRDPRAFKLLVELHISLEESSSRLESESAFLTGMGMLLERHALPSTHLDTTKERGQIAAVRGYLEDHYTENIALSDLASLAGLSPYYLLRVFKNQFGCPPHEYQTQMRVAHAKRSLRDGGTLLDAAHDAGFFDQSHLSRNFKRIVGLTPGQYLSERNIVQDAWPFG